MFMRFLAYFDSVNGILDEFAKEKIAITTKEVEEERNEA
jgi:hypothetical protein